MQRTTEAASPSTTPPMRPPCDQTAAWAALTHHFAQGGGRGFDVRTALATEGAHRVASLSQAAPMLFADLSKNRIDATTEALLRDLARERGLQAQRDAMFAGEPINRTEQRAVMHFLLRNPPLTQEGRAKAATDFVANQ